MAVEQLGAICSGLSFAALELSEDHICCFHILYVCFSRSHQSLCNVQAFWGRCRRCSRHAQKRCTLAPPSGSSCSAAAAQGMTQAVLGIADCCTLQQRLLNDCFLVHLWELLELEPLMITVNGCVGGARGLYTHQT